MTVIIGSSFHSITLWLHDVDGYVVPVQCTEASDRNARFGANHGIRNTRYLFIVIIWTWITPKLVAAEFHTERENERGRKHAHGAVLLLPPPSPLPLLLLFLLRSYIFSSYKYWWHDADGVRIYIAHAKSNQKWFWHKCANTKPCALCANYYTMLDVCACVFVCRFHLNLLAVNRLTFGGGDGWRWLLPQQVNPR